MNKNVASVSFLIPFVIVSLIEASLSGAAVAATGMQSTNGDALGHHKHSKTRVRVNDPADCTNNSDSDIVVIVKKGGDPSDEIPVLDVCTPNIHKPVIDPQTQNLTIHSDVGEQNVKIRFHLDKSLKHTHWKNVPNHSVWLADTLTTPTDVSVPGCMHQSGKNVNFHDQTKKELFFVICSRGAQDKFAFALHLDQTGDDAAQVDLGIDPQIINSPYTDDSRR
jgi:hypothetical protein